MKNYLLLFTTLLFLSLSSHAQKVKKKIKTIYSFLLSKHRIKNSQENISIDGLSRLILGKLKVRNHTPMVIMAIIPGKFLEEYQLTTLESE